MRTAASVRMPSSTAGPARVTSTSRPWSPPSPPAVGRGGTLGGGVPVTACGDAVARLRPTTCSPARVRPGTTREALPAVAGLGLEDDFAVGVAAFELRVGLADLRQRV